MNINFRFTAINADIKANDIIGWPDIGRTEALKVTEIYGQEIVLQDSTGQTKPYHFTKLKNVGMVYRPDLAIRLEQ